MIPAPGLSLLQYRLIEQIGEGGDGRRLARFEREAKLLASLSHPKIAAVYGLHVTDGIRFLAMEMVKGEDLAPGVHARAGDTPCIPWS